MEIPVTALHTNQETKSNLSVELITNEADFDALAEEWELVVQNSDVHIFQTFEWQQTWWKIFGGGNDLHILLFREEGELVGIMPMFLDYFKVMGSTVYRCLRMIGSRVMQPEGGSFPAELAFSDYLSIIALPEYETEVNKVLKEYLESNTHLYDEIMLEEVPEQSTLLTSLLPRLDSAGWSNSVEDASVCPLIRLPETWDDFLMDLSSNARYQIRRFVRQVTEEELFEIHTAGTREEVVESFENLVEFHQTRWHKLGQPGIFMDDRIHRFFREITMRFHEKGWLLMKTVTAEDQCVAVDLLFKFKGIIYMVQRGFDDTSEYKEESPGSVLLYYVIKEAIEEGFETYDFLRGEESYKLRTATHTPQNKQVRIKGAERKSRFKAKVHNFCLQYSHFKRKLRNERDVVQVYMNSEESVPGMRSYVRDLYKRGIKKLKN